MMRVDEEQLGGDADQAEQEEGGELQPAKRMGIIVQRERLLRKLSVGGQDAGITIVCAPEGFGKTALLLQYRAMVEKNPERGVARVIDAGGMDAAELGRTLQACGEELPPALHPLICVDDMPAYGEDLTKQLIVLLRALREQGFEVVLACRPGNSRFMALLGDSVKIGAGMLKVQPREYSDWARAFAISSALDVYELTQGVPSLIVQLRNMTSTKGSTEGLDRAVAGLYRGVLEALNRARDPLHRLACFFILMRHGTLTDFERAGMRMRKDPLSRMARDYPIFGYDAEARTFACMGDEGPAMTRLRRDIVKSRPSYLPKVMRMLMRANRVDDAVHLAEQYLGTVEAIEVISQFPTQFAMSGNALYVHEIAARLNGEDLLKTSVGMVLAVYLSALAMGEYRLARAMCVALKRRAAEIETDVDPKVWAVAQAMSEVWEGGTGLELPKLSSAFEHPNATGAAALLRAHKRIYGELLAGGGSPAPALYPEQEGGRSENRIDLPQVLLSCDRILDDALHQVETDASVRDEELQELVGVLTDRHLAPIAARVRMAAATRRLLLGEPVVDERAFTDAGTVAVRESDFATQLFCLLGEGWQALATNQVVNARFRAQQVLKLADDSQGFLKSWALLLERTAYVLNTSQVSIRDEAELLDLSQKDPTPAEAWAVALHLSAARFDSELSAWFSMHKNAVLEVRFCPMARLAMHAVGERADPLRNLFSRSMAARYQLSDELAPETEGRADSHLDFVVSAMGQVSICLFGGFRVERNGHVLTDEIWKRKKSGVLAARLGLSLGSFVGRRTLTEELWPKATYARARENLYVTLSTLRTAFGQQDDGPQYVLTQGDGLALNTEFVASDTSRFDILAREILLKRSGISGQQVVEGCLKMEQLYRGPLYVPDSGDAIYFLRMRNVYLTRFIDCMLRGIDISLDANDLNSALWLVEASLKNAPLREDVLRAAMRTYDLAGRKREVVELYNNHTYYLEHELQSLPDDETRRTYEEIIQRSRLSGML